VVWWLCSKLKVMVKKNKLGKDKVTRKIYLIFCYILDDEKSSWKQWNLVKKFIKKSL
jgi:hypothetical protein